MPVVFFPGMAGHLCPTLRATSLSLSKESGFVSIARRFAYERARSVQDL
jgi:hypothetical protein